MADPSLITNRRHLLIGMSASALTGSILFSPSLAAAGVAELDPAFAAYLWAEQTEEALNAYSGPEDDHHERLIKTHIAAEYALAETPSTSLHGLRGKVRRQLANMNRGDDDPFLDTRFGRSILHDLERLIGETS